MIRDILIYPDDKLFSICEPVMEFGQDLHDLVTDLFETMYASNGVGLAAPQIGVNQRVFVMDVRKDQAPFNPMAFINPGLRVAAGGAYDVEGCLSMPGLRLRVRRATYVHFSSQTLDGETHWNDLHGMEARVFQHELDHLDGILLPERAEVKFTAAGV